jgi:uracil phosphoribosyltransferase
LFFAKLPDDIAERYVLLLDPMLATGGSAMKAIEVLIGNGVPEERILFLNLVSSPEGIQAVCDKFKKVSCGLSASAYLSLHRSWPSFQVKIISAWVDQGLDANKYGWLDPCVSETQRGQS